MNEKQRFSEILSGLLQKNMILKILSVLLAILVWAYILYAVDPATEENYTTTINMEKAFRDSIPEQNGYMYLSSLSQTNFNISVTISGSRTQLLQFNEEDISATLDLNEGVESGICAVKVVINTGNKNVDVLDYSPKTIPIEFAKRRDAQFTVQVEAEGTLPEGYFVKSTATTPEKIKISGPSDVISTIDKVFVKADLNTLDITKATPTVSSMIEIVDADGKDVDRTDLTIESLTADTAITLGYQKNLDLTHDLVNASGGNEASYINVVLDRTSILATGEAKNLVNQSELSLRINSSTITESGTIAIPVSSQNGSTTFEVKNITAKVTIADGVSTKQITFSDPDDFVFKDGIKRTILQPLTITVRARSENLKDLSDATLRCTVNTDKPNADGSYPVVVTALDGTNVAFGVVGSYSISTAQARIAK